MMQQELDAICSQTATFWKKAARRELSITLAAFLTITALFAVERTFSLREHIATDVDTIVQKWMKEMQRPVRIRFTEVEGLGLETNGRITDSPALEIAARILNDCCRIPDYDKTLCRLFRSVPLARVKTMRLTSYMMTLPWTKCKKVFAN